MSSRGGRPIALIGLMGAGKSAVALAVAAAVGGVAVDLDAAVVAAAGCTIAELFEREGEARFRELEQLALEAALTLGARVIACGGGIVLDRQARELLDHRCDVVWLEVSPAIAAGRLAGETASRPLLEGTLPESRLAELLEARRPLYEACAHLRVNTDGRSPTEVTRAVLDALNARK